MKIEYKNKFKDIFIYHAVHQFLSSAIQIYFLLISFLLSFSELSEGKYIKAFIVGFMGYILIWIVQIAFNAIFLYSKKSKHDFAKHIIEVSDEHLYEETEFSKSFVYWPGVLKAVSRPGYAAIYITPSMAYVIPSRAFKSKTERLAFLQLVTSKINAGKKTS